MNAVDRRRAIKFLEKQIDSNSPFTALDYFKLNIKLGGKNLNEFLARIGARNLIDGAFTWKFAAIGDDAYWRGLSLDWVHYLNNKGKATWGERILSIFY